LIPDQTFLVVVVLVLLCVVLLNALIFKPVLRVMDARMKAVTDARQLAQSAAERAAATAAEYDQKLTAARTEVYREMDEKRRMALDKRASLLGETRAIVEHELSGAARRLQQEAAAARATLDREAESLAGAIVTRVLGR
jgi:F-type H+-transporting ATPase subunit b